MFKKRYQRLSIAAAIGLIMALIMTQLCLFNANGKIEERKSTETTLADTVTEKIDHIINDKLLYSDVLESLCIRETAKRIPLMPISS